MSLNLINPYQQFIDTTGKVRQGGFVTFSNNRTTTRASIFSDDDLTVAQTNPYELTANGQIAGDVKFSGLVTIQETNFDGSDIITTDDVASIGGQSSSIVSLFNAAGINTITAGGSTAVTALIDKTIYIFTAPNTITGATTLQIDATVARSILKYHDQPLVSGDIEISQVISVMYNSVDDSFELLNPTNTITPEIQSITATVSASAMTLGLKAAFISFRKTPLTDGISGIIETSDLSLVVPSGATLGTRSTIESRIVLIAIDNSGTLELACINSLTASLDETELITTVAIGTGSDSPDVFYSTTARASVPYRVVGFEDSTQASAGTWNTAPTLIQGAGGEALRLSDRVTANNTAKTASYVVSLEDRDTLIKINPTSAFTITLPVASFVGNGFKVGFQRIAETANTTTIDGNGTETINLALGYFMTVKFHGLWVVCDGSNWWITSENHQATIQAETSTNLNDITHLINIGDDKMAGTIVFNSTTGYNVTAVGDTDGALWVNGVGTTVNTPV